MGTPTQECGPRLIGERMNGKSGIFLSPYDPFEGPFYSVIVKLE